MADILFDLISDMKVKAVNVGGGAGVSEEEQLVQKLIDRFPDGKLKDMGHMIKSPEFLYLLDLLRVKESLVGYGEPERQKNYLQYPMDLVKIGVVLNSKVNKNA